MTEQHEIVVDLLSCSPTSAMRLTQLTEMIFESVFILFDTDNVLSGKQLQNDLGDERLNQLQTLVLVKYFDYIFPTASPLAPSSFAYATAVIRTVQFHFVPEDKRRALLSET